MQLRTPSVWVPEQWIKHAEICVKQNENEVEPDKKQTQYELTSSHLMISFRDYTVSPKKGYPLKSSTSATRSNLNA